MMRTSLYLPTSLHQRLLITARKKGHSLSGLIGQLLDDALTREESRNLERLYQAMDRLKGVGNRAIADGSSTIDDVLYGDPDGGREDGR